MTDNDTSAGRFTETVLDIGTVEHVEIVINADERVMTVIGHGPTSRHFVKADEVTIVGTKIRTRLSTPIHSAPWLSGDSVPPDGTLSAPITGDGSGVALPELEDDQSVSRVSFEEGSALADRHLGRLATLAAERTVSAELGGDEFVTIPAGTVVKVVGLQSSRTETDENTVLAVEVVSDRRRMDNVALGDLDFLRDE